MTALEDPYTHLRKYGVEVDDNQVWWKIRLARSGFIQPFHEQFSCVGDEADMKEGDQVTIRQWFHLETHEHPILQVSQTMLYGIVRKVAPLYFIVEVTSGYKAKPGSTFISFPRHGPVVKEAA